MEFSIRHFPRKLCHKRCIQRLRLTLFVSKMPCFKCAFLAYLPCCNFDCNENEIKLDDENTDDAISACQAELRFLKSVLVLPPWHCPAKSTILKIFWVRGEAMETAWRTGFSHSLLKGETQREKTYSWKAHSRKWTEELKRWLCGKMGTLKVIMFVCPRRRMASLCPQKVMLESFCSKRNHVA